MQRLIDAYKLRECEQTWDCDYEPDGYSHVVEIKDIDEAPTVLTIPDNPTNGDITKAMFPNLDVIDNGDSVIKLYKIVEYSFEDELIAEYSIDWWNAPYKGESEE